MMKDVKQLLLRIPGVTEAQVFAKMLVRCQLPMTDDTIIALQEAQDWIEHETGWKVEMTVSVGKRLEPIPPTDNEEVLRLGTEDFEEFTGWKAGDTYFTVKKGTGTGGILTHEPQEEGE